MIHVQMYNRISGPRRLEARTHPIQGYNHLHSVHSVQMIICEARKTSTAHLYVLDTFQHIDTLKLYILTVMFTYVNCCNCNQ